MIIKVMEAKMKQSTFIMLKPDAIHRNLDQTVMDELLHAGCKIKRFDTVEVDESLILKHYEDVIKNVNIPQFKQRVLNEYVGEIVKIYELEHDSQDVISLVRELIGATEPSKADPQSIRGKHADDDYERSSNEDRLVRNLIHASDSQESAKKELELWFNR
jgi:nucleoside-diphosphate kinase